MLACGEGADVHEHGSFRRALCVQAKKVSEQLHISEQTHACKSMNT